MMKKTVNKIMGGLGYVIKRKTNPEHIFDRDLPEYRNHNNKALLVRAQGHIKKLKKYFPELRIEDHKNGCIIGLSGVNVFVENVEEFFILNEVFTEQDYQFSSPEELVLIDIGANIGISSLFFSLQENVKRIYAYEPVKDTFEQAELNFSLNKEISKVVSFNNFGIGKDTRKEVFSFNKEIKGNTGIRGKMSGSYAAVENTVEREVLIKPFDEEIKKIRQENSENRIAVKMDCEGAEYEIFDHLNESGAINQIDYFMIEWHDRGPEEIEKVLLANNFEFFSRKLALNAGMIYAIKRER
ncbi:FkbM family methyltransferase [Leptobacterium flavescens]|uniref:FkbM family methyltransferase n=1 Tax=Leptobacterium flavescens TaxID=472055 RepID=A0A6P0UG04_9FLAO|nr:FkbM family methyltransferase [Leptobacterium flavescens]NER12184.1 FkbM family methyltransferase [Leptobacterium flavescens]